MPLDFSVLSWNVQGEIGIDDDRMEHQLDFLNEHITNVDCFLLQAVNSEEGSTDNWEGQLGTLLDYFRDRQFHVVHSGDWAQELFESTVQPHAGVTSPHNRCNLTASRWPIERRPLSLQNAGGGKPRHLNYYYSHFPEKIVVGEIDVSNVDGINPDNFEIWNVGILNGAGWGEEKLNMLETVYARIYLQTAKTDTPIILGGDFNAPKRETPDGAIIPHGQNKGQYVNYPYYGDPHYLRPDDGEVDEWRFDDRWRLAETRIFDPEVGEWGMRDVYWIAEDSPKATSTEDYTHHIPAANPSMKRLDHILVSEQFDVYRCELLNGKGGSVDGLAASDHAPVFTELEVV